MTTRSTTHALAHLDEVVNAAAVAHNGERPIEQGEGDSFVVTFSRAADALAFAIDVQRTETPLSVRMAIHTGEAERRDDGRWLGPTLNRCARIRALAAGSGSLKPNNHPRTPTLPSKWRSELPLAARGPRG